MTHITSYQSMFKKYLSWKPQEMVKVLLREVLFISFIVILLQPSKAKGLLPLKAFLDYASIKKYNLLPSRKRSILFDIDTLSLITDKVRLIFINICNQVFICYVFDFIYSARYLCILTICQVCDLSKRNHSESKQQYY